MSEKTKNKQLLKKLRIYKKEYEQVKSDIKKVDFICEGSFLERRLTCGNPKCRCHKAPQNLHGPYYQLSWKNKGKTVSRFLSPEVAELYQEWINNRRRLTTIIDNMKTVSKKAIDCILKEYDNNPKKTGKINTKKSSKTRKKSH